MNSNNNGYSGTYQSGAVGSYPVMLFPPTAYLGLNRKGVGQSSQSQPSDMAKGSGATLQFNSIHQLLLWDTYYGMSIISKLD